MRQHLRARAAAPPLQGLPLREGRSGNAGEGSRIRWTLRFLCSRRTSPTKRDAANALLRDHAGGAHRRDGACAAPGLDAKHTVRAATLLRGLRLRLCAPRAADDAAAPGRAARRRHARHARHLLAGPRDQRLATPRAQGELQLLPSLQGATRPYTPAMRACAMRLCYACASHRVPCVMCHVMPCACAARYSPWCVRWRRWHRGLSSTTRSCSTTTR